jgi:hypothetical protein
MVNDGTRTLFERLQCDLAPGLFARALIRDHAGRDGSHIGHRRAFSSTSASRGRFSSVFVGNRIGESGKIGASVGGDSRRDPMH